MFVAHRCTESRTDCTSSLRAAFQLPWLRLGEVICKPENQRCRARFQDWIKLLLCLEDAIIKFRSRRGHVRIVALSTNLLICCALIQKTCNVKRARRDSRAFRTQPRKDRGRLAVMSKRKATFVQPMLRLPLFLMRPFTPLHVRLGWDAFHTRALCVQRAAFGRLRPDACYTANGRHIW